MGQFCKSALLVKALALMVCMTDHSKMDMDGDAAMMDISSGDAMMSTDVTATTDAGKSATDMSLRLFRQRHPPTAEFEANRIKWRDARCVVVAAPRIDQLPVFAIEPQHFHDVLQRVDEP